MWIVGSRTGRRGQGFSSGVVTISGNYCKKDLSHVVIRMKSFMME